MTLSQNQTVKPNTETVLLLLTLQDLPIHPLSHLLVKHRPSIEHLDLLEQWQFLEHFSPYVPLGQRTTNSIHTIILCRRKTNAQHFQFPQLKNYFNIVICILLFQHQTYLQLQLKWIWTNVGKPCTYFTQTPIHLTYTPSTIRPKILSDRSNC